MKYLGVDPGEARVGLAVSDPDGRLAMPLRTLHERSRWRQIDGILAAAQEEHAEAIVVGVPYTLRGEIGPNAERVLGQVEELQRQTKLPVHTFDERFSSGIVENAMLAADVSVERRKQNRDRLAAVIILQSYLDKKLAREAYLTRQLEAEQDGWLPEEQ